MPTDNKIGSNRRFSPDIYFDEAEHIYMVDGKNVPSVTEVLAPLHRGYGKINASILEYAANRGKAVHSALEVYDLGGELEATPETAPYIQAYLEWEQVYRPQWLGVEQIVYHPEYGYIGTLDRAGILNGERRSARECSECGAAYFVYDAANVIDEVPNYCPNCGAKMDEVEE